MPALAFSSSLNDSDPYSSDSLDPERDEGCGRNDRQEVAGEFVVARGDAAEALKFAEGGVDAPAPLGAN